MKLSSVFVVLAISSGAFADNCRQGLTYCGSSLLKKGNYDLDIRLSLQAAGKPTDGHHINDSLFVCLTGDDLSWTATCRPQDCLDNGAGRDDSCIGDAE
ncbi:hypothetical protein V8E54_001049 [Elaphomyces granulatus]